MEVHITSKQMVKLSSSKLHLLKPFKLSLLDQLSLTNYAPMIFFYAKPSDSQFSDRLKNSLSKALTQFYPLAGRTKDNLFISDYDEGVPYIETRVKGRLSDFIDRTREELEAMNHLFPCRPYCKIPDYSTAPQLAVQVNMFDCGGIALALRCFHKLKDATTVSAFLKSWTAFCRDPNGEIPNIQPDLLEAGSRFFPPIESMMMPNTDVKPPVINEYIRYKTRCFVFDTNAIAIQACRSVSGTPKTAVLWQIVNIRGRMKPQLPDYSIGNLFCMPSATYNPVKKDIELTELTLLMKEATKSVSSNATVKSITEQPSDIIEIISKGNADLFGLNSWLNILDGEEDFG